jgi:hypothetical protein
MSTIQAARFENSPVPETIGRYLHSSFQSEPLTEGSEAGEEPIKPDQARQAQRGYMKNF